MITKALSEREAQELADQQGRPCACDGNRLCLGHYGLLDSGRQAAARRQAGVHEPYLGPEGNRYGR
jgi:hypothetical protein